MTHKHHSLVLTPSSRTEGHTCHTQYKHNRIPGCKESFVLTICPKLLYYDSETKSGKVVHITF